MLALIRFALGAAAATLTTLAAAQGAAAYPSKPLRVIVPFAPGGGVDAVTRRLGEKLGAAMKQPVVIENKPGASGMLALDVVAKAAPDGHTFAVVAGSALAVNPHVFKKIPYDTAKDLVPVTQVGTTGLVLLVKAENPARNLKEFIAAAKAKPRDASFGSFGNATLGHLLGEALNRAASIEMLHVPFKGAAPAITDLLGGQIAAVVADFGSSRALLQAGKIRALAISGAKRNAAFPNVPTFTEEGFPAIEPMTGWIGIVAPAATPKDVVAKLASEVTKLLDSKELDATLADFGYDATGGTPEKFGALVAADRERWGKVIKAMGGVTLD